MTSNFEDFYKNKNIDTSKLNDDSSKKENEKPLTTIENPKLSKVINFEDFIKK